jgi:hypothetical protein
MSVAGHSVVVMELMVDLDDGAATLAALSGLRRVRMAADRDILVTAVHYADVRNGDTARTSLGPDGRALPGMERPVRLGGAGTRWSRSSPPPMSPRSWSALRSRRGH